MFPVGEKVEWAQVRNAWALDVRSAREIHGIDAAGPDEWSSEKHRGECLKGAHWTRISALGSQVDGHIYVVNGGGWREEFGEDLRVPTVAAILSKSPRPSEPHGKRIMAIVDAISRGAALSEIILISPDDCEPAVIADGNHRAVALSFTAQLWRHSAYLGTHPDIAEYPFYKSI